MHAWMRRAADRIAALDRSVTDQIAAIPPNPADAPLRVLTAAADRSLLWLCIAALLATRKGPTRRAAFRGLAAIAGTSTATSVLARALPYRRRPPERALRGSRALPEQARSSSFPSRHAASAAAFTTAAAMECTPAGVAVAPLAATVAYSRMHTGPHWPSDVVAGAALGTALALATKRWWPVRPSEPARARPRADAPALPQGDGLVVVYNPRSGRPGVDPSEEISRALPAAKLVPLTGHRDVAGELEAAITPDTRAIGIAGGDGSVAAAATLAVARQLPLVVLPAGTFNHFARDVGIDSLQDAVAAVNGGHAVMVDIAWAAVDGVAPQAFLNTASLGGYPDLVRLREKWQRRWGKWLAAGAALVRVLAEAEPLRVHLNGRPAKVWILFVGNGPYHPLGMAPVFRPRLDAGVLDVRYLRADLLLSRARFVLAALTGALRRSRTYAEQRTEAVRVDVRGDPVALATDGEVDQQGNRFEFTVTPRRLTVYRP